MTGRSRGDHAANQPWHSHQARESPPSSPPADPILSAQTLDRIARRAAVATIAELARSPAVDPRPRVRRRRTVRGGLLLAGCIAVGLAAGCLFVVPTSPETAAPATPLRWVNAYEAAAIDNPRLVCSQLFAPPLAKAFARVAHRRCASYFSRIRTSSLKILAITEQGQTAVISLHQTIENTDWVVVLQRRGTSWWAIDLVTGRALR